MRYTPQEVKLLIKNGTRFEFVLTPVPKRGYSAGYITKIPKDYTWYRLDLIQHGVDGQKETGVMINPTNREPMLRANINRVIEFINREFPGLDCITVKLKIEEDNG